MPYITQEERKEIEPYLKPVLDLIKSKENNNNVIQALLCNFMGLDYDWILFKNVQEIYKIFRQLCKNIKTRGHYNYVITRIMHNYIKQRSLNYDNLNDIVGIVENSKLNFKQSFQSQGSYVYNDSMEEAIGIIDSAKDEFKRMVVNPYEDIKISLNGPISKLDRKE